MLGSDIKQFRLSLKLSQKSFGEGLGLKNPQIQVSQLESGNRIVTDRMEKMISKWQEAERLKRELKVATDANN